MLAAFLIAGSYLLGSVPFGLIIGRLARGIDIREHGSGNIGFTNVSRVAGAGPGLLVLVLDFAKGAGAVLAARAFFGEPADIVSAAWVVVACAMAVIAGHNWSVFLGFKGGKGVAAGAGALAAFVPELFLILLAAWLVVTALTRYVSLASIAVAALYPVLVAVVYPANVPYLVFAVAGSAAVLWQHRGNIRRLITHTEHRLGERSTAAEGAKAHAEPTTEPKEERS